MPFHDGGGALSLTDVLRCRRLRPDPEQPRRAAPTGQSVRGRRWNLIVLIVILAFLTKDNRLCRLHVAVVSYLLTGHFLRSSHAMGTGWEPANGPYASLTPSITARSAAHTSPALSSQTNCNRSTSGSRYRWPIIDPDSIEPPQPACLSSSVATCVAHLDAVTIDVLINPTCCRHSPPRVTSIYIGAASSRADFATR